MYSKFSQNLTENFATEAKAEEIEQFFAEYPFPGTERTVEQSVEIVRLNTKWLERDYNSIKKFLTSR